jgi:C-terminal processing protease CtpA/Prc
VYASFVLSDGEKKRIDGVFRALDAGNVEDLILDLRGNSGGNSEMGDFIFSYLTERPFRSFSRVRVKLSPESLATYGDQSRFAGHEGLIITYRGEEKRHARPETPFEGRVTLLVDNATFSSAMDFAAMFRDYEIGEIIGYETGGLPISFGDVLSLSLDNSRIPYGVSYKQFFGPRPRPGDDEHGVIPDIVGTRELLAPHRGAEDPLVEYVVDRLAETGR